MKELRFSRETLFLFAILVLSLALRLWGVNFGLPYLYHADEPIVVNHALAFGTGDLNPHFFKIPPLVSYLLFGCYGIYYAIGQVAGTFQSIRDFEHLFYFDPTSFYLIARIVFGVILGTLSIWVLFRLAKHFWGSPTALWTSFFLATNFLHVRDSHYIYADIPLLCVLMLGFGCILQLSETIRGVKDFKTPLFIHLGSGALIGLAVATKYNGIFLVIPYLWVCLRTVPAKAWLRHWILAGFAAFTVFLILNPFAILDHSFFLREISRQSAANCGGYPWSHHLSYSLVGALGWPMVVLGLMGVLRSLFGKDLRSQTVGVFVVSYYAVICRFGQPYDRYALPLIPFMLLLAAQVLIMIQKRSRVFFWILIPLVALPSIIKTIHWDYLMSAPDVRTIAKEWTETNLPTGSKIALDGGFYMPRLAFTPGQLREKALKAKTGLQSEAKIRRINALLEKRLQPVYDLCFLTAAPGESTFLFGEPLMPYDLNALKVRGVQYVFLIDDLRPAGDVFFCDLQKNSDRIMTFSPYRDSRDLTLHDPFTMTGGPFLWKDILPRTRGGYPISIYRLRT